MEPDQESQSHHSARMERRSAGGEEVWCEQRFSYEGRDSPSMKLRPKVLWGTVRLNEADQQSRTEAGCDGMAVSHLGGATIMVPVRDAAERQFSHRWDGLAQADAHQDVQA